MKRRFGAVLLLLLSVAACRKPEAATTGESCTIDDDGGTLDVTGRADGVYGVRGERVDAKPLVHVDKTIKLGAGVDAASGKRFVQMRLSADDARALGEFTSSPGGLGDKRMAVVAGGELASVHKIRQPITGLEVQVSCCNPRACDRWEKALGAKP